MATATVTGLTLIHDCDDTNGLVGLGGGPGAGVTEDVVIQGSGAIGRRGSTTTDHGFGFNVSAIDFTVAGRYLWIWINVPLGPAGLNTIANSGLSVRVGSSDNGSNNYKQFAIGGGDFTAAGWRRYIIDLNKPATITNGSPNISSIVFIGIVTRWNTVPGGNIPHLVMDAFHYGGALTVTGGSSEDRLTFQDIADFTEDTSRSWAVLRRQGGVFFANGDIQLGDTSGTGSCFFSDNNQIIEFNDQVYYDGSSMASSIPEDLQGISVVGNSTGTTEVQDGEKIGSGDEMSGSGGSIIQRPPGSLIDLHFDGSDANVDELFLYGTQIKRSSNRVIFGSNANAETHEVAGVVIDTSETVDLGRVIARDVAFQNYSGDDAALLWNSNINIKNSAFRNNSFGTEHLNTGTFTYDGLTFIGNGFDVKNNSGGHIEIGIVGGGTIPTFTNIGGSTTDIAVSITHTLIGLQQDTEVTYVRTSDDVVVFHVESVGVSGETVFTYTEEMTVNILIFHYNFRPRYLDNVVLGSVNQTLPITQELDRNVIPLS